jgi:hypothetical protein
MFVFMKAENNCANNAGICATSFTDQNTFIFHTDSLDYMQPAVGWKNQFATVVGII